MPAEKLLRRSIAALAGSTALVAAVSPASAITLAEPALPQTGPQVEKVWCGWGGCGGWGWGPAAVVGGVIAGTAIGAAAAASSAYYYPGPYYYGPAYYGPGPCLRRWVDYYGYVHWRRVC